MVKIKLEGNMLKSQSGLLDEYKNYTTIRRNLRQAYESINECICIQEKIKQDLENRILGVESKKSLYHATILYIKWFMYTDKKIKLNPKTFFVGENEYLLETHKYLKKIRNKYMAHNEKDILSEDIIFVTKDINGNICIHSEFKECVSLSKEILNNIRKCIEVVHNVIDSNIIPDYEKKLIKYIGENNII